MSRKQWFQWTKADKMTAMLNNRKSATINNAMNLFYWYTVYRLDGSMFCVTCATSQPHMDYIFRWHYGFLCWVLLFFLLFTLMEILKHRFRGEMVSQEIILTARVIQNQREKKSSLEEQKNHFSLPILVYHHHHHHHRFIYIFYRIV